MFYTRKHATPDCVLVFGSNTKGNHDGGGARCALNEWGAEMGKAEGRQGQSYAIPTVNQDPNRGEVTLMEIEKSVDKFIEHASQHPEEKFLLTEIGCGAAGFKPKQIAPMFMVAPKNVVIPESFAKEVTEMAGIFQTW
jgi:hypothetical protein